MSECRQTVKRGMKGGGDKCALHMNTNMHTHSLALTHSLLRTGVYISLFLCHVIVHDFQVKRSCHFH